MKEIEYFRIKNWEKYQDPRLKNCVGGAPYVRLYTNVLDDPKICQLSTSSRLVWVLLIALSGRVGARLRYDSGWVQARLGLKHRPDLALFESLGLIVREPVCTDKSTEEQIREDNRSPLTPLTSKSRKSEIGSNPKFLQLVDDRTLTEITKLNERFPL